MSKISNIFYSYLTDRVASYVDELLEEVQVHKDVTRNDFESWVNENSDADLDAVICGNRPGESALFDFVGVVKSRFPDIPIFLIEDQEEKSIGEEIEQKITQKFTFPLDKVLFAKIFCENLDGGKVKQLKIPVESSLLEANEPLSFPLYLYLPMNDRYFKYFGKGIPVESEKIEKIKKEEISTLYINASNYKDYVDYINDQLKKRLTGKKENQEWERSESLKVVARDLIVSACSGEDSAIENSILLLEDCQNLILESTVGESVPYILSVFSSNLGVSTDHYDRGRLRATLACLIGTQLELNCKDMMVACLFQDYALWKFDPTWSDSNFENNEPEIYRDHPVQSCEMVKKKFVGLSATALEIISQHHERYDGGGFPGKIAGEVLSEETQVIIFVNEVEKCTSVRTGEKRYRFNEILEEIKGSGLLAEDLEKRILDLFSEPEVAS